MTLQYFLLSRNQEKRYDQNIINNKILLVYLCFLLTIFSIKYGEIRKTIYEYRTFILYSLKI